MQMADADVGNDDEVLDLQEPETVEESEESGDDTVEGTEQDEAEDVVVSIGGEAPPQEEERAPEWVRELRKSNREKDRRLRELEEENGRLKAPASGALKAKPTLEACEFDPERFERELEAWHEQKRVQDAAERKKQDAAENERKAWAARLEAYGKAKGELKVKDFEDAEALAQETFSQTQQGVIVSGAENPALLVYALGKNPKKAKELASITDPVKFAFAVAKLETQLKVSPRKAAPPPEGSVRGSAPVSGVVDSHLARLEAEAEKTGDRSKVVAYKRKQRAAGK